MIYNLKVLSTKYKTKVVYETISESMARYVVGYGENNPVDFWLDDYGMDRKNTKEAVIRYLKGRGI